MHFRYAHRYETLKKNHDDRPQSLYITLTIDGVPAGEYSSGVQVRPSEWDQKKQRITNSRLASDQAELDSIRETHKQIRLQLQALGKPAHANAIKAVWVNKGHVVPPGALKAWSEYLAFLRSQTGTALAKKTSTLTKWTNGSTYLAMYIKSRYNRLDIEISELSVAWVREWHTWLMTHVDETGQTRKRTQHKDTAYKHVEHLKTVFDWVVERKLIEVNPIEKFHIKRSPPRAITYLLPDQIRAIEGMHFLEQETHWRDLALFACYTGLDYPVLLKVIASPSEYREKNQHGKEKLNIHREKGAGNLSIIPLIPQAAAILDRYAGKRFYYPSQSINRFAKYLASQVKFKTTLNFQIFRKTAGCLWLNAGYSIEMVSKLLGHKTIKTTQAHYATILDRRIDREMETVGLDLLPTAAPVVAKAS